jgi:hypothetical protein
VVVLNVQNIDILNIEKIEYFYFNYYRSNFHMLTMSATQTERAANVPPQGDEGFETVNRNAKSRARKIAKSKLETRAENILRRKFPKAKDWELRSKLDDQIEVLKRLDTLKTTNDVTFVQNFMIWKTAKTPRKELTLKFVRANLLGYPFRSIFSLHDDDTHEQYMVFLSKFSNRYVGVRIPAELKDDKLNELYDANVIINDDGEVTYKPNYYKFVNQYLVYVSKNLMVLGDSLTDVIKNWEPMIQEAALAQNENSQDAYNSDDAQDDELVNQ